MFLVLAMLCVAGASYATPYSTFWNTQYYGIDVTKSVDNKSWTVKLNSNAYVQFLGTAPTGFTVGTQYMVNEIQGFYLLCNTGDYDILTATDGGGTGWKFSSEIKKPHGTSYNVVGWTGSASAERITLSANNPLTFTFATIDNPLANCIAPGFHVGLVNSGSTALTYNIKGNKAVPEPATLLGFGIPMLMVGLGKLKQLRK